MKKLIAAALMLGFATFASAQAPTVTTPPPSTIKQETKAPKMEKKHRMGMGHKPATTTATTTGATSTTTPAQGTMMKHEGEHKSKRTPAEEQAAAARSAARDKVISKDAEGHDIHLGPNGGQYYINKEGTKTYLKSTQKVKTN